MPLDNPTPALSIDPGPTGLPALEARLARDRAVLNQPAPSWLPSRTDPALGPVLDVAVIGAGMAGLTVAHALIRDGIPNLRLFDASPEGAEGPWVTYARMETLRSPKGLTGPALGLPSLAFRAWYEAQFGSAAWDSLWRIPRPQWMDYLRWYRKVLALPVTNEIRMTGLAPHFVQGGSDLLALTFSDGSRIPARRVVLATGRDGLGGPIIPSMFKVLPPTLCAHSSAPIGFPALANRHVAVVGAGASGFDNAGAALEAGAATVTMLMRRAEVPRIHKGMGVGSPGMNAGYYDLSHERRLALTTFLNETGVPPPRLSVLRCTKHKNFHWIANAPVSAVREHEGKVILTTPSGETSFDFVIPATGFAIDTTRRPEIAAIAQAMRRWSDDFPEVSEAGADYGSSPYLGPAMEFLPRTPADAWVSRVTCLNFAGTLSHFKLTGDIPGISEGAARLADGLVRSFFVEDFDHHWQRLQDYDVPELRGDEGHPEPLWTA